VKAEFRKALDDLIGLAVLVMAALVVYLIWSLGPLSFWVLGSALVAAALKAAVPPVRSLGGRTFTLRSPWLEALRRSLATLCLYVAIGTGIMLVIHIGLVVSNGAIDAEHVGAFELACADALDRLQSVFGFWQWLGGLAVLLVLQILFLRLDVLKPFATFAAVVNAIVAVLAVMTSFTFVALGQARDAERRAAVEIEARFNRWSGDLKQRGREAARFAFRQKALDVLAELPAAERKELAGLVPALDGLCRNVAARRARIIRELQAEDSADLISASTACGRDELLATALRRLVRVEFATQSGGRDSPGGGVSPPPQQQPGDGMDPAPPAGDERPNGRDHRKRLESGAVAAEQAASRMQDVRDALNVATESGVGAVLEGLGPSAEIGLVKVVVDAMAAVIADRLGAPAMDSIADRIAERVGRDRTPTPSREIVGLAAKHVRIGIAALHLATATPADSGTAMLATTVAERLYRERRGIGEGSILEYLARISRVEKSVPREPTRPAFSPTPGPRPVRAR
jgi:hypothetical protein